MNRTIIKIWIFALAFLPITISLGIWQLDRSAEKTLLLNTMNQRFTSLPVQMQSSEHMLPFKHYLLQGTFSGKDYLLDNRIKDGQVGYEVLSPLYLTNRNGKESFVLVNRGWIKAAKYREVLPEISSPSEQVELSGYFHETDGKVPVLREIEQDISWPLRIQQTSWKQVNQQLNGTLLFKNEFRLSASNELTDQSNSRVQFRLGWPKTSVLPEKHTAYAFQWFALATALLILSLSATYKLRNEKN